jgi:hypothetical protein
MDGVEACEVDDAILSEDATGRGIPTRAATSPNCETAGSAPARRIVRAACSCWPRPRLAFAGARGGHTPPLPLVASPEPFAA